MRISGWEAVRLEEIQTKLLIFTQHCRDNMHEPQEQGIEATVVGERLDNAHGDSVESGEFVVVLGNQQGDAAAFNLADLIALARQAVLWDNLGDE